MTPGRWAAIIGLACELYFALQGGEYGTLDQLQRRDAEVREALLRTLGSKTVPELANVANRDTLKAELRNALLSVLDRGDVRRIHLPQFVIQ